MGIMLIKAKLKTTPRTEGKYRREECGPRIITRSLSKKQWFSGLETLYLNERSA